MNERSFASNWNATGTLHAGATPSIEAIVAFPDAVAYEASKGGIDALTRQVAVDYGAAGIRCNGVRPGAIMTPLADVYLAAYEESRDALVQSWRDLSPLGRVGEPRRLCRA